MNEPTIAIQEQLLEIGSLIIKLISLLFHPVFIIPLILITLIITNPKALDFIFSILEKIIDNTIDYTPKPKIDYTNNQNKGTQGEVAIYKHLINLEVAGARFLFNTYIPKSDGTTTEIDVLMLCSKGIFVFESKNYSGLIIGNEKDQYWTQILPTRQGQSTKHSFYNPIMQNQSHINHLRTFIGYNIPMWSIIVFSDRCTLKEIQHNNNNAKVIQLNEISHTIYSIYNNTADVLNPDQVSRINTKLYPNSNPTTYIKEQHIKNTRKADD